MIIRSFSKTSLNIIRWCKSRNAQIAWFSSENNDTMFKIPEEIASFQAMQDKLNDSVGVFRESETEDIQVLVNNFTAPALASALRDRESTLQHAAILANSGNFKELSTLLLPFLKENVSKRRVKYHELDLSNGFTRKELVIIQRYLHRMPRQVYHAVEKRASVVIPLCNVNGVASVLFERRSATVKTHKQQVCFPGGMLEEGVDSTIIQTSLREMEEELGNACIVSCCFV